MGLTLNLVNLNLHVADLERAVDFYALLGWTPIEGAKPDRIIESEPLDCGGRIEHGGGRFRSVLLSCGSDPRATTLLQLSEYIEPKATPKPFKPRYEAGAHRITMRVHDIDAAVAELRQNGVEIAHEPQEAVVAGRRHRYVIIADPDDNPIEVVQLGAGRKG